MSATQLGLYLRRIRLTRSIPALYALSDEIERELPTDEAMPRLLAMIAVKAGSAGGGEPGMVLPWW
ncbi:MAG: hypothetical protein O2973_09990 [Gemmatimonadetes bacterium]|nr:hypothetical protein [Gemmatimonadota bacterium]